MLFCIDPRSPQYFHNLTANSLNLAIFLETCSSELRNSPSYPQKASVTPGLPFKMEPSYTANDPMLRLLFRAVHDDPSFSQRLYKIIKKTFHIPEIDALKHALARFDQHNSIPKLYTLCILARSIQQQRHIQQPTANGYLPKMTAVQTICLYWLMHVSGERHLKDWCERRLCDLLLGFDSVGVGALDFDALVWALGDGSRMADELSVVAGWSLKRWILVAVMHVAENRESIRQLAETNGELQAMLERRRIANVNNE
jgi:hypothetical protein